MALALSVALVAVALATSQMPQSSAYRFDAAPKVTSLNERPIIGILSQPGEPAPQGMSYIAASYIKWVELAGARVVPILYDMTAEEIRQRFNVINGMLIPGGGATLSPGHPFYDASKLLFDLTIEANENGDYFPLHGTCLGMETLCIVISENYTLLDSFEAEDAAAALLFTEYAENSFIIKSLPPDVVHNLQNQPMAMENHQKGVSMPSIVGNSNLSNFWDVLSLSLDKNGRAYVSTLEAKKYPVTATQWHPEKNAFEWSDTLKSLMHTPEAIRMTQEIANFFVSEARKNQHKARSITEEDDMLVYNWAPHFTGVHDTAGHAEETDFEQAYFFESASKYRTARTTVRPTVGPRSRVGGKFTEQDTQK